MSNSNLNKITEGIIEQAKKQADEIIEQAKKQAVEIHEKETAERTEWEKKFNSDSEKELREIKKRADSKNRQNRRLALLETRNRVIDEAIAEAKAKLTEQSGNEKRFQTVSEGNILFNNSIEAVFEAEMQTLRDKAYEVLSSDL